MDLGQALSEWDESIKAEHTLEKAEELLFELRVDRINRLGAIKAILGEIDMLSGISARLREHADRIAGGGPGEHNYDPETLGVEHEAADTIDALTKALLDISNI